ACSESAGSVFDPAIVDVLKRVVHGEEAKKKLSGQRAVLLVDPVAEDSTLLELRLVEHGFDVVAVPDAETALRTLGEQTFDLVVTEIELPRADGFALLEGIRAM